MGAKLFIVILTRGYIEAIFAHSSLIAGKYPGIIPRLTPIGTVAANIVLLLVHAYAHRPVLTHTAIHLYRSGITLGIVGAVSR